MIFAENGDFYILPDVEELHQVDISEWTPLGAIDEEDE